VQIWGGDNGKKKGKVAVLGGQGWKVLPKVPQCSQYGGGGGRRRVMDGEGEEKLQTEKKVKALQLVPLLCAYRGRGVKRGQEREAGLNVGRDAGGGC